MNYTEHSAIHMVAAKNPHGYEIMNISNLLSGKNSQSIEKKDNHKVENTNPGNL